MKRLLLLPSFYYPFHYVYLPALDRACLSKASVLQENLTMNWINLTTMSELDKIKEDSFQSHQFIFKHSTRCSISKMVLSRFESTNDSLSFSVYLLTY